MKTKGLVYIEKLIEDLKSAGVMLCDSALNLIINNQPIVDAVEVTRCENCMYHAKLSSWYRCGDKPAVFCDYWGKVFNYEDYCSKGKPRIEDEKWNSK